MEFKIIQRESGKSGEMYLTGVAFGRAHAGGDLAELQALGHVVRVLAQLQADVVGAEAVHLDFDVNVVEHLVLSVAASIAVRQTLHTHTHTHTQ